MTKQIHPLEGAECKVANTVFKVVNGIVSTFDSDGNAIPWAFAEDDKSKLEEQANRIYEMSW